MVDLAKLQDILGALTIKANEPLSNYTYTKTGGPADLLVFPRSVEQVQRVLAAVKQENLPLTVLGNASNLIVKDGGIRGLVMILTDMQELVLEGNQLKAASGAALIEASRLAAAAGLTGLEFACGIPGSIGGAIYMNAGAYGGEVKDVISQVEVVTRDGQLKTYAGADCDFSYRHSRFQEGDEVILGVTFDLAPGDQSAIDSKVAELTHLRQSKQPLEYPSCGSVFKRPEGYFAGKLIQDAGLQGYQVGGAQVSTKHAGFIVNVDHATATDYLEVIEHIRLVVWARTGVFMEPEVRIIGED
ncbi:UDP-N-acetylmuramate dehydrogenase [uncultured Abiotrophia sp.]|uniref:UDP-N-acetylmuramate dehydrogenase n=1 Tax=uncultured Abiotrophia sp. TaxID=316094 RepID=UPI0028EBE991|nr:UDP-N-acetylmuramate dehydrogenase [uncultured Abiotrophia sp.]